MAAFEYKALDARGKQKKGVLEGDHARQIRQRLKEQGLIPVEVVETRQKGEYKSGSGIEFRRGISSKDLSLITRQLATLVQAGMPLEECLRAVAEQSEKSRIRTMIVAVRSRVMEGYTLSEGLAGYPQVFNELFCAMVAAGERSGHLDMVLNRLADYAEHQQQMRSKLQQALIYPAVLTVFAIGIVAFLLASVVPTIVEQFVQMGQVLPLSTRILLTCSEFVQSWGLIILLSMLVLFWFIKWVLKKPSNRLAWDRIMLKLPIIGKVVRGLNTARFARTLAICTSSAIPLLEGMKVAVDVMANRYVQAQVLLAAEKVREGVSLRKSLEQTRLFPPMMLHMIASGEQSGELEPMLTRAADNQDKDFSAAVNIALDLFTPLLIAAMAGVVLFIVTATMMPILEMNNLITG
ncbi:type II secretion system protein GspF [Vibrio sp. HA2012]|uniref:type II secretion system inner membrane protein GspF n=1 Tax=Vibrio sp. HA2012 TaxID=1971595 RepID=UPI000C2C8FC3|nr:type II secretion system inner membrane protein GspF [Vibrio sp. HA2012]PJC85079.1 type II secretion system protein GspF [Vibrio sp. HA2012]